MIGQMPAGVLAEIAVVEFEAGEERCEYVLGLAVEICGVAVGVVGTGHHVEQRRWSPRFEHADDAYIGIAQAQGATYAVGAAKQFLIEVRRNHRDLGALGVVLRGPAVAVLERHVEHRKEIRRNRRHRRHHRRQVDVGCAHAHRAFDDQGLAIGAMRAPQVNRRLIIDHVIRLLSVARGRIRIDLRIEQVGAASRDRIARQQPHHRQRGHARTDADGNRDHHQCGQHLVALEASKGQIEVIGKHPSSSSHGLRHTDLVATTGGTEAAFCAGPNTDACPSNHSASAPPGR